MSSTTKNLFFLALLAFVAAIAVSFVLTSRTKAGNPSVTAQKQAEREAKEFVGEGVVVAFQKYNRYPVMPHMSGPWTHVEFWIVRIDRWTNEVEPLKEKKYFACSMIYMNGA